MFNLKDILKAVEAKEKPERKDALLNIAEDNIRWSYEDRALVTSQLPLTRYEVYWLMWRIRVHLRSYETFEWSEMKDVLVHILKLLEKEWEKCPPSTAAPSAKEISLQEYAHPLSLVDTV